MIEAMQLRWDNWHDMCDFAGVGQLRDGRPEGTQSDQNGRSLGLEIGMFIPTLEGMHLARQGDWVIKGVKGELYPCKPDIFELTYEPVTDSPVPDLG